MAEHISRLIAARFQWDVMGSENLVIARTDSESGKLISSNVDVRDHEFILGVTEDVKPLAETLYEIESKGASAEEINKAEKEWVDKHELVTYDEGSHVPTNTEVGSAIEKNNINSPFLPCLLEISCLPCYGNPPGCRISPPEVPG